MNTNQQITVRRVLYGNAIFCGISGLGFALASNAVSSFLGLDAALIIFALGIGLVGYAGLIYLKASRPTITREFVLFAIIADSAWVLGSVLLLITNWIPFSVEGKWAIGIIAAIVDMFATLQFMEWRKI